MVTGRSRPGAAVPGPEIARAASPGPARGDARETEMVLTVADGSAKMSGTPTA